MAPKIKFKDAQHYRCNLNHWDTMDKKQIEKQVNIHQGITTMMVAGERIVLNTRRDCEVAILFRSLNEEYKALKAKYA